MRGRTVTQERPLTPEIALPATTRFAQFVTSGTAVCSTFAVTEMAALSPTVNGLVELHVTTTPLAEHDQRSPRADT